MKMQVTPETTSGTTVRREFGGCLIAALMTIALWASTARTWDPPNQIQDAFHKNCTCIFVGLLQLTFAKRQVSWLV